MARTGFFETYLEKMKKDFQKEKKKSESEYIKREADSSPYRKSYTYLN